MAIRLDDALCIAMCQKGLRDRMLHYLWIPILLIAAFGITVIAAEHDVEGFHVWAVMSVILIGCILARFAYLCGKCRRLVEKLQSLDTQEIDLQLGAAQAWGGSVYLLDRYVFEPKYFLLVPYTEIERFRVRTWETFVSHAILDAQLTFYTSKHRRYRTTLKKPEQFDKNRFQSALQAKKNACF